MIRDKIIQGLRDKPLQERFLRESTKKPKALQDVVSECKAAEHSKAQAREMNENQPVEVDAVNRAKSRIVSSRGNQPYSVSDCAG